MREPASGSLTKLVLASSSTYRASLLERLAVPFEVRHPRVDEAPRPGEAPRALVHRLAILKARAVQIPGAEELVIGSDQVAECEGRLLGKPLDVPSNIEQLEFLSGKAVRFHTSLCVLNAADAREAVSVEPFEVTFRSLTRDQITAYVAREQALDCAGGFKAESLGIALFARMSGHDPTALIGLPLIRLSGVLKSFGFDVLTHGATPSNQS